MMGEQNEEQGALDLGTFTQWMYECQEQPAWRTKADKEADYCDGNQLDSEVMRLARERGLPPAIEPLIGPTIDAILGMEAKTRTDWRVIPDSDKAHDDVAEALNYRLNQAERHSKADAACSEAYASQVKVGLGWVEVAREQDPFRYQYRACAVHRNEIWFDWRARDDMSNARYLIRRKWMQRKQAKLLFPDAAALIESAGSAWQGIDPGILSADGGISTSLATAQDNERGWSIEEQEWRDTFNSRVCLFEVWYRDWQRVLVIKAPDGRVVEYDGKNPMHVEAVASGMVGVHYAVIGKVRLSWWMGPHRLSDEPSPYRHHHFPYVPFWGKREDRTGAPFGLVRGMIYLQDEVNARIAKMQWGLGAVRTTRTEGAVLDDDDTFRDEIGRPDADIVLDPEAMRQGGVFKVERDFELNRQQYDRLVDARDAIKRVGGVSDAFMGQGAQSQSGVMQAGLVEQSNQNLADINDNFKTSRQQVGDILLSLIIEDMGSKPEEVFIDGGGIKDDKTVVLNVPAVDESGITYLDNDVQRTKLKVTLADVPSTPSFRTQQLAAMSEAFKSAPPEYQKVMMPHLFALMDVPNKQEMIEAIKALGSMPSEEEIEQRIKDEVQKALNKAQTDVKMREIEQRQPLVDAQVAKTRSESVNKNVEGQFGAIQTAQTITAIPQTAPLADMLLRSAGYQDADAAPIMPAAPAPVVGAMPAQEGRPADLAPEQIAAIQREQPATPRQVLGIRRNTSPQFPANPAMPANPDVGVNAGIEGGNDF
jgi:hypothetical protein